MWAAQRQRDEHPFQVAQGVEAPANQAAPRVGGFDWWREPLAPSDVQRLEDAARAVAEAFPPGAPQDATAAAWVWMTAYGVEGAGWPASGPAARANTAARAVLVLVV